MYFHLYVLDNLIMMMFVAELVHAFPCSLGRWPHLEREGGFVFWGGWGGSESQQFDHYIMLRVGLEPSIEC